VKGLSLIFLAFLFPLAVYLLVLGRINRRRRPLLVPGIWDLIGLLWASSGLLLFGGPALLSSFNSRWRLFWLLGTGGSPALSAPWVALSLLYLVAVVGGVVYAVLRHRRLTSIYNATQAAVERALVEVCEGLGLDPVRSGNVFVFGMLLPEVSSRLAGAPGGIQAPHYVQAGGPATAEGIVPPDEFLGQTVVLEVEAFAALRHVTLRWDPAESPLRREIEQALRRRLAQSPAPEHDTGTWLTVTGLLLLAGTLCGSVVLVARALLRL
jgi:hypothetical protein